MKGQVHLCQHNMPIFCTYTYVCITLPTEPNLMGRRAGEKISGISLLYYCTCVHHVLQHGHLHMHVQPFPESSIITSTATVIGNGSRGAMGHMLHLNVYKESTERAHFCVYIHNKVRTHIICMSIHTYVYTMPFVCTFRPSVLLILSQTVVPTQV